MKNDQQVVSYIKEANTYVSPEVSSKVDKDLLPTTERISNRLSYFACGCAAVLSSALLPQAPRYSVY